MRLWIAALLGLTAACSAPDLEAPHGVGSVSAGLYTVVVSPSPELAAETAWAVSEWQAAGAAIIVGPGGVPVAYGVPHGSRLGEFHAGAVVLRGQLLRMTLLHELGHVLGVGHLETGLMTEGYQGVTYECVDQAAADAIGGTATCGVGKD